MLLTKNQRSIFMIGCTTAVYFAAFSVLPSSAAESFQDDLKQLLADAKRQPEEGHHPRVPRELKPKKKKAAMDKKKKKGKNNEPTGKPTGRPTGKPTVPPVGPLDRSILTCSDKSIPTFCQAPDANIDCQTLLSETNACTAFAEIGNPQGFVVYDPNNCGDGIDGPISGCGAGGREFCRVCGRGMDPTIFPCAFGFYSAYYEPRGDQTSAEANERSGEQDINAVLALPVRINCEKYYAMLEGFRMDSFSSQSFGPQGLGYCAFDAASFEFNIIDPNFSNNAAISIQNCPPQFIADYAANWLNANYQAVTTTNSKGETFPSTGDFPDLAVGKIPALLPPNEFEEKCKGLALGQEINIFDAGEISTFTLTAKKLGERILRPAAFDIDPGISNCVNVSYVSETESNSDPERCKAYSASTIDNPLTWINATDDVPAGQNIEGQYIYHVPSAARPETTLAIGQRTQRVAKQMHGKGQSCIYAKFSFEPLKANYAANFQQGDDDFIPLERRVGFLNPVLADNDIEFDTLVRLAGNKNITDIKDVHDQRVRGFGLKLFGVDTAFEANGLTYNQLWLPQVPAYDQPENAQYAFGDFNFISEQEVGTVDWLHVAIGTGEFLNSGGINADDIAFDPTTEEGARNPPDNVFIASNVDNYYNGFILGGGADILADTVTAVYQNPLEYIYGSASPLRAGPSASMKLSWAACPGELSKIQNVYDTFDNAFKDSNFMATNLRETLQKLGDQGETEFKMCGYMQFQENPCTEPLDNPTTRWLTPNIKVFELTFPAQTVPNYNAFCDNTVLTPWRNIQEHQPQSFINRVRNAVYAYAWQFRLIANNGSKPKPGKNIFPPDEVGTNLCPYGFDGSDGNPRWQPIPVGKRTKYQGPQLESLTQLLGDIDELNDGMITAPLAQSSSGVCNDDNACMLPFGTTSVCNTPGFENGNVDDPTGKCVPTNDGNFGFI